MAAPPFTIELDTGPVLDLLHELRDKAGDLTDLMAALAGVLEADVQQNFENQADPVTGNAWPELDEDYVERPRTPKGGGRSGNATPILVRDGNLSQPAMEFDATSAALVFPEVYAALHNFGGTDDMPPGPAAVPQRRFAAFHAGLLDDIEAQVRAYMAP